MNGFNNKFLDMVANSLKIEKLYNELYIEILNNKINDDKYKKLIINLYDIVIKDNLIYNNLSKNEVNLYLDKVNMIDNEIIDRIKNKLNDRERILTNSYDNIIVNNDLFKNIYGEFILSDIIEYVILVDTYSNAYNSINNVYVDNYNDELIKNEMLSNLYISLIKSIASFGVSEVIGLENELDIERMPVVDIDDLISKYAKIDSNIYYYSLLTRCISLIEDILKYTNYHNRSIDVFNTLMILSEIEVVLNNLDGIYLDAVTEYFNFNSSFIDDSLSKDNVRRLIRERNQKLGRF